MIRLIDNTLAFRNITGHEFHDIRFRPFEVEQMIGVQNVKVKIGEFNLKTYDGTLKDRHNQRVLLVMLEGCIEIDFLQISREDLRKILSERELVGLVEKSERN